jgi:hypothetical protein
MLFEGHIETTVHERGGVAPARWADVDIMPEGYIVPREASCKGDRSKWDAVRRRCDCREGRLRENHDYYVVARSGICDEAIPS